MASTEPSTTLNINFKSLISLSILEICVEDCVLDSLLHWL